MVLMDNDSFFRPSGSMKTGQMRALYGLENKIESYKGGPCTQMPRAIFIPIN